MLGLFWLSVLWIDPLPPPSLEPPAETVCKVEVKGMPASARSRHELVWPGGRAAVDDVVDVRFRGRDASVTIRGPRYEGRTYLSAAQCSAGTRHIDARPRPARIEFRCSPADMVVRCDRCPGVSDRWVRALHFPDLAMTEYIREVVLEFKAPGYRSVRQRVILYPGRNLLDVQLERLQ